MSRWLFQETIRVFDVTETGAFFFYMALTQGHLLITVARTHFNHEVFDRFYWRFTLAPILIFAAAYSSHWAFAGLFVLMVFWDVYHSSLQVFGLGRIYDRKAGNDPSQGRYADYLLCVVMYAGPVLGGALIASHLAAFSEFDQVEVINLLSMTFDGQLLASVPGIIAPYQTLISNMMIAAGVIGVTAFVISTYQATKRGYRLPPQKLALFLTTMVACIAAWGFNSFAMGYLIANVFHAIQYFALVWWLEDKTLRRTLPLHRIPRFLLFLLVPIALGLILVSVDSHLARSLLVTCALMHFWWDGFIWSVRSEAGFRP